MLHLLSYVVGALAFVGAIACVALGLLKVCDFMEESPRRARSVGRRMTWSIVVIGTVLTFTDHLPYSFLLASWAANAAALSTLHGSSWPLAASLTSLALPLLSPLLAHLSLMRHFHHVAQPPTQPLQRIPWPGGRQDWDIAPPAETGRVYGNGEALTCLALCWSPAIWVALGAIAQNWAL